MDHLECDSTNGSERSAERMSDCDNLVVRVRELLLRNGCKNSGGDCLPTVNQSARHHKRQYELLTLSGSLDAPSGLVLYGAL